MWGALLGLSELHFGFRQALQDPQGALNAICEIGTDLGLPVTVEEVKDYLATLDDIETKKWLMKARGGL